MDSGTDKTGAVILPVLPDPFPPVFASDWGQDEYGLWMGIEFNGIRQGFRWLVPGFFLMGSPGTEPGRRENETQHKVTLTQGFWLADTACTQELWQAVTGDSPSEFKGKDHPVDTVSWEDCRAFLDQINKTCPGLDLDFPTEAQWEYACREPKEIETGKYMPFSFGKTITPELVNYSVKYPYFDAEERNYRAKTVLVKNFAPNGRGLYQMHGNLYEWCRDWYADYESSPVVDPLGPDNGKYRVLRGGSWIYNATDARSACRIRLVPGNRYDYIGFRFSRGLTGRAG